MHHRNGETDLHHVGIASTAAEVVSLTAEEEETYNLIRKMWMGRSTMGLNGTERKEYVERDELLKIMWHLVQMTKDFDTKTAFARAYVEARELPIKTGYMIEKENKESRNTQGSSTEYSQNTMPCTNTEE